uniref:C2H2-type domain-containing protein n=1 Tax=Anopheles christyi TaxID=43041 RepID=A0A182JWY9_9DIPT
MCEICDIFVIGIRLHLIQRTSALTYCTVKMKQKRNITAHINTVHFKMVFKTCGICGKGFIHHKTYRYHMLTHETAAKTCECKDCEKTFSNEVTLRDHFKRLHSI